MTISDTVLQTITDIKSVYDVVTKKFYESSNVVYESRNLKKFLIDEAFTTSLFMAEFIPDYIAFLNDLEYKDFFEFSAEGDLDFRYRVKLEQTVDTKMAHNLNRHLYVSKLLNDLFGARLILNDLNRHQAELLSLLQDVQKNGLISRFYERKDGLYRGYHCYFQDSNKHLAWELQLWDGEDKKTNFLAHVQHELDREQGREVK